MKHPRKHKPGLRLSVIGVVAGVATLISAGANETAAFGLQAVTAPDASVKPIPPSTLSFDREGGISPLIDAPLIESDPVDRVVDLTIPGEIGTSSTEPTSDSGYPLQTEDHVVDEIIELSSEERFDPFFNPWFEWDDGTTPLDEEYPWEEVGLKITRLKVTGKSYIAPIGNNIGNVPGGNNRFLNALAGVTDRFFSENPRTDRMDHAYRLFSSVVMLITCDGNTLVNWAHTPYLDDTGTEPARPIANLAALQAPRGVLREEVTNRARNTKGNFTRVNNSTIRIDWAFYGRPHPFAEPPLTAVSKRTGKWIWHRVDGFVSCNANGVAVPRINVSGSAFPSHRLWINRALKQTVPQGPFSNLWANGGEILDTKGKSYKPKVLKVK